ncbi:putative uncharacterized protein [Streptomyces azureus]|uniref:Uncharacterized protein n=1 Tax=Streptomyces azureus TaxID=146537 RepID=A0A0K8PZ68_STRAJ|nr:putative uncharacterized protein [Streptomyces azureus]
MPVSSAAEASGHRQDAPPSLLKRVSQIRILLGHQQQAAYGPRRQPSPSPCPHGRTALQWAWRIATPWMLSGPEPGVRHEVEGIASSNVKASFRVPGIEWTEFTITAG